MNTFASSPVRRTFALLALALLAALAACEDNIPSGEAPPPPAVETTTISESRATHPPAGRLPAEQARPQLHSPSSTTGTPVSS